MTIPRSRIVLGTDRMIAFPNSADWNLWPTRKADAIMEHAFNEGINAFDTARLYASEGVVGRFIRNHQSHRSHFKIISKGGFPGWFPGFFVGKPLTLEKLVRELDKSLKALGTKYIDIYLLHYDDPRVPAADIADWSRRLLKSGDIRNIGYSNISLARLKEIRKELGDGITPWVSNRFNALGRHKERWMERRRGAQNISQDLSYVEYLRAEDLPFLAYSPLGHGYIKAAVAGSAGANLTVDPKISLLKELSEKYNVSVPVVALHFVLQTAPRFHAIVGTSNVEHLTDDINAEAEDLKMTDSDYARLADWRSTVA